MISKEGARRMMREDKSCWPFEKKGNVRMSDLIEYITEQVGIMAMEEPMDETRKYDCDPEHDFPSTNNLREVAGYGSVEEPEDPWIHRSDHMRCRTCMWYARKDKGNDPQTKNEVGRCRRHAPTMNGYPVVFPTDWCGDHKLNERVV